MFYPYFIKEDKIIIKDLPFIEKQIDSIDSKAPDHFREQKHVEGKLFSFDPNIVTHTELLSLGFSEKQATTFIKFRTKGFVFRKKEDLLKVFGISKAFYSKLEPYLLISVRSNSTSSAIVKKEEGVKASANILELNGADSISLLGLKGIGPAFAKRILKYRSLLGGFVNKQQLKEVYGFTEEMYSMLSAGVSVDARMIKKLNVNNDDFKTINKHPYFTYEITKEIFDAKMALKITPDILKEIMNDEALFEKAQPYIIY